MNLRQIAAWPPERRRRLAVGLLAGVVALVIVGVGVPVWLAHRHYDQALGDIEQRLGRYERLAAQKAGLEQKLEALRGANVKRLFLRASAASLSAAEIQDKARQLVEGSGGRLISVQPGQGRDEGRFRQVTVTLQFNAGVSALRRILLQMETVEPYLFVESMTVRAQVPPGYKPPPGGDPENFVQIDVTGFALVN